MTLVVTLAPYGQQENDEVTEIIVHFSDNSDTDNLETTEAQSADLWNKNRFSNQLRVVPDDNVINKNIRSLNMQQREIVIFVPKWSRDFIKSLGWKKRIEMLNHFIYLLRVEQGLESLI